MENTQHYKELLENELKNLEAELATVGRKNPDATGDWEAVGEASEDKAESGDVSETIETFENNRGILNQLEVRLNEVKSALSKIENGSYGTCETCGSAIEEDRLEANPAAPTCKAHME